MNKPYKIVSMELGPMQNFVYLIIDRDSKRTAIVDPAWDMQPIHDYVSKHELTISDILLTHSHHDHINGVEDILQQYDPELHLLKAEADFWQAELQRPSLHAGGDQIQLGRTELNILHTPGHTPGSACYQLQDDIITGDTLFVFGCGRCDLDGGNPEDMFQTLQKMKHELPAKMQLHPGHNYSCVSCSSIEDQLTGNPFLHFSDSEVFIDYRMDRHDKIRSTPYQPVKVEDLLS